MPKNKHLTFDERTAIQSALHDGQPFRAIASALGKDPSTISKEIRGHLIYKKTGGFGVPFNECRNRFSCIACRLCPECIHPNKKKSCRFCQECNRHCSLFEKETCALLASPPYVCNGCGKKSRCSLEKRFYCASDADKEYRELLSESRSGFNLNESELAYLDSLVSPLIQKGQSPHHICMTNSDSITVSQSSIYRYLAARILAARNMDLPRKMRFRVRKAKKLLKVDKACRIGRTYQDFLSFLAENPDVSLMQMDSVEGKKGEAVLLTLHFIKAEMMLAFPRPHNTSESVIDIWDSITSAIGLETFSRIAMVCLTDNGTEFSNPGRLEFLNGKRRTRIYYCDPGSPYQKGACERNHEFIRQFIPKGTSMEPYSQSMVSLMMDHINSYARDSLGGKCPYEMFEYLYGKEVLELLGCHRIPAQEVTLNGSIFSTEVHHA